MSTILEVRNLFKAYSDQAVAANGISFSIEEGEFVTLLGPSGCGKTTTLRIIAGFESPDSGHVLLDNQEVTAKPPHRRPINMMFQDFALWPHMTVANNIAYGLKIAGVDRTIIDAEVSDVLDLVALQDKASNFPQELSIGQRQRIALARAIVKKPRILLLDEPMSALDAKLRDSMQTELRSLQKSLGMTFVMVTHDQTEAMRMSDRIIVMADGGVIQIGSPADLYEYPTTPYIADFIGRANLIDTVVANVEGAMSTAVFGDNSFRFLSQDSRNEIGQKVTLCIRPEKILLRSPDRSDNNTTNEIQGKIISTSYSGNSIRYEIDIGSDSRLVVDRQLACAISSIYLPSPGESFTCYIPADSILAFIH